MRYWKRVNEEGQVTTIEAYLHDQDIPGAFEITEDEYKQLLTQLVRPPEPVVDMGPRAWEIVGSNPHSIPAPEIWELLALIVRRIFPR